MPEGDTIHRVARRHETRRWRAASRAAPRRRTPARRPPARRRARGAGRSSAAEARGKHLLAHFSGGLVLHSHLGMNGRWSRRAPTASAATAGRGWLLASGRAPSAAQCGGQAPAAASASRGPRNDPGADAARPRPARAGLRPAEAVAAPARGGRRAASSATRCSTSGHRRDRQRIRERGLLPGAASSPWRRLGELDRRRARTRGRRRRRGDATRLERGRRPRAIYRAAGRPARAADGDLARAARATPTASPTGARAARSDSGCA